MTKRKRTKCQTTIHTTQHRKLNILQHEPYQKPDVTQVLRYGKLYLLH